MTKIKLLLYGIQNKKQVFNKSYKIKHKKNYSYCILYFYFLLGAIYINDGKKEEKFPQINCQINAVPNEQALIETFVSLVRKWDPDIFVGYEVGAFSNSIFLS